MSEFALFKKFWVDYISMPLYDGKFEIKLVMVEKE